MAKTEANPPMPRFVDDYVLQTVDADYLAAAVKPKQFINIDQSECIQCEGCVDICPWKCIHYIAVEAIDEAVDADLSPVGVTMHVLRAGFGPDRGHGDLRIPTAATRDDSRLGWKNLSH